MLRFLQLESCHYALTESCALAREGVIAALADYAMDLCELALGT
jgi:hypothetical protein